MWAQKAVKGIHFQVFSPTFRDPPPPPLELFDLDEAFSSERSQLARLANKCLQPHNARLGQGSHHPRLIH